MEDRTFKRLESLDTLRGFDMLFIMGGAGLLASLNKWFPCGFTEILKEQMGHADWNGLFHHDTIFPLFLFIAGISFPFSLAKQKARGKSMGAIYRKIIYRGLMLVFLGLVYNGLLDFRFDSLRCASVLARIGLGWMFAALLFVNFKWKTRAVIAGVILIAYWLVAAYIPAPGASMDEVFTDRGSIVCWFDRMYLPGRLCYTYMDPEGLLSTFPGIVTAMLGMFTGEFVRYKKEGLSESRKVLYMVIAGIVLAVIAIAWNEVFPINKKMWTSSFVCAVGSYSILMFALFYYIIDVKNLRGWTKFFVVIGMNSITIYLAQRFIRFQATADAIFGGVVRLFPENAQSFFSSAAYITVCWIFLYFLYKKNVFLKV